MPAVVAASFYVLLVVASALMLIRVALLLLVLLAVLTVDTLFECQNGRSTAKGLELMCIVWPRCCGTDFLAL